MAHSKRARAQSRLFSLSARLERRATSRIPTASAHAEDDGCPICVAARTGQDVLTFFPGADGSAPEMPEAVLVTAARKAMMERRPKEDEAVPFIEYGRAMADGRIASSSFSVDGAGRIFWISPKERRLVLAMPPQC